MNKRKDLSAILLAIFIPSFVTFLYFVVFAETSFGQVLYSISRVFLIAFPVVWVMLVDKQKFPLVRLKKNGILTGIVSGILIGALILAAYFLLLKDLLDFTMIKTKAEQLNFTGTNFFFIATFITLFNSGIEEYFWRWFAFTKLRNLTAPHKAIIISALGFTLHHIILLIIYFGIYGILISVGVFIGGVIWAYFYKRYDSVIPSFISHLLVDAALMTIGYDIIF